jgi:two-component system, OmpR family, sensor kinase
MSGADILDAAVPSPPSHHRGVRHGSFRRLSDRTPLRIKLITLLFALVAIALSVIGFVTVIVFSGYLQNQADTQLESLYNEVLIQYSGQGAPGYPHRLVVSPTNLAEFIPASGGPVQQLTPQPPTLPLPVIPTSQAWLNANSGNPATVPAVNGNYDWRVIVKSVTFVSSGQSETGLLVVGVNLFNIHQTIDYLTRLDIVVSAATVLVLVVVGIAVVQANLRPLNDIEMTAGEIAKGHLDHRIPERDPRTEIGSLGRSLNAMLTQIESAFHAQEASEQAAHQSEERMRRFIADASHELRTPLTTIRGFAAHYRQRGGASRLRWRAPVPDGSEDQNPAFRTSAASSAGPDHSPGSGIPPDGMSPGDLDHLVGRVEAEATRMGLLVEDLLTLARLDQQRPLAKAPVDVLTLAADAVQDARIVSPGRPIDLIVAPGTAFLVDGDEPRLRQVLSNLVNNAITHTPAGTPVRVRIARGTLESQWAGGPGGTAGLAGAGGWGGSAGVAGTADAPRADAPRADVPRADAARAGRRVVPAVVLDVVDDGPGMTADQAQRVFERFYRADAARNRASGGTGLGLAIVAGLVSAHGGTVSVRTVPGQGADFQVKLPLSPDALAVEDADDDDPPA